MKTTPSNRLVAIVGGSGAGKGWLAERLGRLLGEQACHLSLDNFYRDRASLAPNQRGRLNFDNPRAIDWNRAERALRDCRAGRATQLPRYDFATHRHLPASALWQPKPLVLVEGLSLLVRPPVRRLFDLKIYLDCPPRLRLRRRLIRDVAERGRTPDIVKRQYRSTVAPMHARYVEPQRRWADLVLAQPFRKTDILQLAERLWALLCAGSPLQSWMRVPFQSQLLNLLECHDNSI
jgi:uridine kinase